jgi:hypothetical protein
METFDAVASELLSIALPPARRRVAGPPVTAPDPNLILRVVALDADGDLDLIGGTAAAAGAAAVGAAANPGAGAKGARRLKSGEKHARRKLQRHRTKVQQKKKRTGKARR